ncbi:Ubiquitin carboxyl-terminal hydrolase 47 [Blattella germanica]|nr:Ubiquitin carboxyl-terminal hydrolase 47 [Blattella germanica]
MCLQGMVCVLEEGSALCIIQDLTTSATTGSKTSLSLPASTTVQELFQEVGRKFQYDPDNFELILQHRSNGESIILNEHKEKTIDVVGVDFDSGARNNIIITDMPTAPRKKVVVASGDGEDDMLLGASASPTASTDYTHPPPAPPPPPPIVSSGDYTYASALIKHDTDRSWISYNVELLYDIKSTSSKSAVETTELTRSFGWDSSEAWQQHDIQELCRVMFDALEQKFKDTEQSDLILRLYEGKMIDYVKCLECGTEKSREDTFLDIPLPVRPFGSTVAYGSVEEAIRAFVQPETLDGNNQYHCEKCNKKCDAHKGLKVVFPQILNLNSFIVSVGNKEESEGVPEESVVKCDDSSTTDSGSALDDESCQGTETALSAQEADYQEDDEGIDMSNGPNHHENEKNRRHTMEKGPYMYELFSIMIHSGSASGGHYYAYIKDFKKDDWFCFNDQSVTRITDDDIALLQKIQLREEQDRKIREKEMDMCKIKLYVHHPTQNQVVESKLYCLNNCTLQEATGLAYKSLHLEGVVPLERCRLVNYDRLQDTIECSFEEREDEPIGEILSSLRGNYKYDLLMEIRKEDQEFETYQPGGVATKVFLVDVETEEVDGPTIVRGNLSQTVKEFKVTLSKVFNLDPKSIKIVLEKHSNESRLLDNDEKTLKLEGFYGSNKIFIATSCDEDPEKPFIISKLHNIIDRFEHIISLQMVLPAIDKASSSNIAATTTTATATISIPATSSVGSGDGARVLGVSSPANPLRDSSPQPLGDTEDEGIGATGHSDQSASEDSSLTDSDRTLVGDVPDECMAHLSSPSNSPPGSDRHNISSPEEGNTNTYHSFTKEQPENWDDEETETVGATTRAINYYFKAVPFTDGDNQRMLKVLVDKRMILGTLKKDLEPYVGVPVEYFKVYRLYTGQQEFECARLNESLTSYRDDEKLIIKLGRALRKGEHRGKVYQLLPNSQELSELSDIPVEYVEFAKGQGAFPSEMSVLGIHTELEWNCQATSLDSWPLSILEDGHIILYRDSREELKQLSSEERKEIASKEGSRVNRLGSTMSTYSPRKERALKIYLDTSPKRNEVHDLD